MGTLIFTTHDFPARQADTLGDSLWKVVTFLMEFTQKTCFRRFKVPKNRGSLTGTTGDGVHDTPVLNKADVVSLPCGWHNRCSAKCCCHRSHWRCLSQLTVLQCFPETAAVTAVQTPVNAAPRVCGRIHRSQATWSRLPRLATHEHNGQSSSSSVNCTAKSCTDAELEL